MTWRDYRENIWTAIRLLGWSWSCVWNAIYFGDPYEAVSSRIGWNISKGGFWSLIWMPRKLKNHFIKASKWSRL